MGQREEEDAAMMLYRKRVAMELQEQHLGARKAKKRAMNPSHKSRFCFDWPLTEDTSRPSNVCPQEALLQFGRGFRAGIDRSQQKMKALATRVPSTQVHTSHDPLGMPTLPHWSEKKLHNMTDRDWRIFREDFNISSYKGSHVHIRPMRSWEESGLSHEILKAVQKAGYKRPSPIQMAAIPVGLAHRDAIGIAETGSGKTASFVLPMLNHISLLSPRDNGESEAQGPYALVLAPTRELAQQIKEETLKLSHYLKIKIASIVGGHSIEEQSMALSRGCEIVIATPGRLLDCLDRKYVVLNQCNYVVLDEADRMISMGFEQQVVGVLNALPLSTNELKICRTMCMFSATMPSATQRLARRYLRDPVVINVGTDGKATDLVTQQVIMVRNSEKLSKLQALLDGHNREKLIMVFVNSRDLAHTLVRQLERQGYKATSLHGGMTQEQREASLKGFKSKQFNCLVATDVTGRGIDIHGVAHVVNYEMPDTIDKYTHRIGRIGRAGNTGLATTFLTLSDTQVFSDLKQMLIQNNSPVPPELARHEASKVKPGTFAHCRNIVQSTTLQDLVSMPQ